MEGRLRFFFGQFNFFSYTLTLISISIIKKNFLGHTDILTYGNDNKNKNDNNKNKNNNNDNDNDNICNLN